MRLLARLAAIVFLETAVSGGAALVSPERAEDYLGQRVTVEGRVVQTTLAKGGEAFLNFGDRFPRQTFVAVVRKSAVDVIGVTRLKAIEGSRIRVTGKVATYKGKPQIVVFESAQLELDPAPPGAQVPSPPVPSPPVPSVDWIVLAAMVTIVIVVSIVTGSKAKRRREEEERRTREEEERRKREEEERRKREEEERVRRKIELNARKFSEEHWPSLLEATRSWEQMIAATGYVAESDHARWRSKHPTISLPSPEVREALPPECRADITAYEQVRRRGRNLIDERNSGWVEGEIEAQTAYFDQPVGSPLTKAQRSAVVTEEDNTLVLAGAGTGKTQTIMAKVAYLLRKKLASPAEILLLAYTKKAACEMEERIAAAQSVPISVMTFHSLGLRILSETEQSKPSLCKEATDPILKNQTILNLLEELVMSDRKFAEDFSEFQLSFRVPFRSAWEFESFAAYLNYLKECDLRTLNGERVKSLEEAEIANWLALHGVNYRYEEKYKHDTRTREYRQYKPDFYLPDYDIYIEHFGLDEDGNPPPFFKPRDKVRYKKGVEWKRETHRQHGTALIETFSHEKRAGLLTRNLERKLRARHVPLTRVSPDMLLKKLNKGGIIDPFCRLLGTFLSLFKSSGMSAEELQGRAGGFERNGRFNHLFLGVLERYESRLHRDNSIDFDDMIQKACAYVERRAWASPYRYIIIDEFQDISVGRTKLVKALREQVPGSKLFCVGDDWQAIYRFAGSDVQCMTHFSKHFGHSATCCLDRTFRFPDKLAAFSSKFVTRNPIQLPKKLSSEKRAVEPVVRVCESTEDEKGISRILQEIAAGNPPGSSVLVVARYNFQLPDPEVRESLKGGHPSLGVEFMTVHQSKALEKDHVIIVRLSDGKHGFPSQIADDPALMMVLSEPDPFPHGEERRLFYVALTRAKKQVYLCVDRERPSAFVEEILADHEYEKLVDDLLLSHRVQCPECKAGYLVKREHPPHSGNFFVRCSMSPSCSYSEGACGGCHSGLMFRQGDGVAVCENCGEESQRCPKCGQGLLVQRSGRNGDYFECSLFRSTLNSCEFKQNAEG